VGSENLSCAAQSRKEQATDQGSSVAGTQLPGRSRVGRQTMNLNVYAVIGTCDAAADMLMARRFSVG